MQATLDKQNQTGSKNQSPTPDYEVIVIGSGFGGICAGIKLKEAGINSFAILEAASDLGGTWRDNTYPGLAVDITSFTYSYSFEQNPNWSRVYAPGAELKGYADHCATKYGIRENIIFNTKVQRAVFDEKYNMWHLEINEGQVIKARYIIGATGGLSEPKIPDIEGIKKFKGKIVHTARWDHDYDLKGKRAAVIGTGATALQLIPEIVDQLDHLDVYQRTPIWVLPKLDGKVPTAMKWIFRHVPFAQSLVRFATFNLTELVMVMGIVYNSKLPFIIEAIEKLCLDHLEEQVPDEALREKLTPKYGFGCKRPSFSNTYLATFNRSDVELVTDSIAKITENGIVTVDGKEREIDTLILATGYKIWQKGTVPTFEMIGRDGVNLDTFWTEKRYQAYEGVTVPKFPNYFMILGPYSFTATSWFINVENAVHHALRCINESRDRGTTRIEVNQKAHDDHFAKILSRMGDTVFFSRDCSQSNSYYFDPHGDAPFVRPATSYEAWLSARLFDLDNYTYS